mgnify:CR=1 FL=1
MALKKKTITESVSLEELIDHIKKNWNTPGLKPLIQFEREPGLDPGLDNVKIILTLDPTHVINTLDSVTEPSILAGLSEIHDAYQSIVNQIAAHNYCLQHGISVYNTRELRFIFDLIIDLKYVDPMDIPGPDNPVDPDRQARGEFIKR